MQTAFLEAVVNRRHVVLGRELHDFCIYDILGLTIAGNPLWIGGRVTLDSLREAVLICSLPPERWQRAELAPVTDEERGQHAAWLEVTEAARCDEELFNRELAAWDAYLADYCALPETTDPEGSTRELKAPALYSLACYVEMHSNMTEREVLTAPYGRIRWKAATIAERLGELPAEILSDEDLAILAEVAAARAAEQEGADGR